MPSERLVRVKGSLTGHRITASVQHDRALNLLNRVQEAHQSKAAIEVALRNIRDQLTTYENVNDLLNTVGTACREEVAGRVETVVTSAVQAMLGPAVSFVVRLSIKRNALHCEPALVYRRGNKANGCFECSLKEVGGGVVDVVSFAARVAAVCMLKHSAGIIIADEPFKHVSANLLPAVGEMVRKLADVTKMQFIIVTHEREIVDVADMVIEVSKDAQGRSVVSKWYTADGSRSSSDAEDDA